MLTKAKMQVRPQTPQWRLTQRPRQLTANLRIKKANLVQLPQSRKQQLLKMTSQSLTTGRMPLKTLLTLLPKRPSARTSLSPWLRTNSFPPRMRRKTARRKSNRPCPKRRAKRRRVPTKRRLVRLAQLWTKKEPITREEHASLLYLKQERPDHEQREPKS